LQALLCLQRCPDLHSVCRSFPKISSALSAKVCGGSRSAKRPFRWREGRVELGEKAENLLSIISDLITRLTGQPPGLQTINAAASALGEAFGDRRILMVVDDAWRESDLHPFLRGGSNTTRLITTRLDNILPVNVDPQPVDAMQEHEAHALLASGLPREQVEAQGPELGRLAARLGKWALLLKLVLMHSCAIVWPRSRRWNGRLPT
jgi:hypothetical protein